MTKRGSQSLEEVLDELHRLRKQAAEYGEIETALIMADREFDGDSEHSSPKARLLDSIARLRTKADLADKAATMSPHEEAFLNGIGVGALVKWASDDRNWKGPKSKERFMRHLSRAYAFFRLEAHKEEV